MIIDPKVRAETCHVVEKLCACGNSGDLAGEFALVDESGMLREPPFLPFGGIDVLTVLQVKRRENLFDLNRYGRYLDRWEIRAREWGSVERTSKLDPNAIERVAMRPEGPMAEKPPRETTTPQDSSYKLWPRYLTSVGSKKKMRCSTILPFFTR